MELSLVVRKKEIELIFIQTSYRIPTPELLFIVLAFTRRHNFIWPRENREVGSRLRE